MNGNRTITKRDSVERIADKTGLKKTDVKAVLQEFLDEIIDELGKGNRLEFRDFGVFEVRERKARTAQNPKTLEPVPVPAKRTVKFKPGRRMKEAMDAVAVTSGSATNPPATEQSTTEQSAGAIEAKPASLVGTPNGEL